MQKLRRGLRGRGDSIHLGAKAEQTWLENTEDAGYSVENLMTMLRMIMEGKNVRMLGS